MSKLIAESDLTPLQRAFLDGFKKWWNLACKQLCSDFNDKLTKLQEDYRLVIEKLRSEKQRHDAIEAALAAPGDPDKSGQLN